MNLFVPGCVAVTRGAVVEELFTVIGSDYENRVVPEPLCVEPRDQSADVAIDIANGRVVEIHDEAQIVRRELLDPLRLARLERLAQWGRGLQGAVVGSHQRAPRGGLGLVPVSVVGVEEEKEAGVAQLPEASQRARNDVPEQPPPVVVEFEALVEAVSLR